MSTGWRATWSSGPSANPSERAYQHLLPEVAHLPPSRRRWLYFKLWPNVAFDIYPDQVDFMQFLPVSADRDDDPRDQLRASRRAARDEGGALPQLADQPPGQCRGHGADPPRPAGHGLDRATRPGPLGESEVCLSSFAQQAPAPDPRSQPAPPAARRAGAGQVSLGPVRRAETCSPAKAGSRRAGGRRDPDHHELIGPRLHVVRRGGSTGGLLFTRRREGAKGSWLLTTRFKPSRKVSPPKFMSSPMGCLVNRR